MLWGLQSDLRVIFLECRESKDGDEKNDFVCFVYFAKTYLWVNVFKENSFKFHRLFLQATFKKSLKFAHKGSFRGLKYSKFHASLRKQRGVRTILWKLTKLSTNIISLLYFKIV